jgi:prephenate dehydrogenase
MGSSFALALKESNAGHVVIGSDTDPRTMQKAIERGVVNSAGTDVDVVEIADVVVLAIPIIAMRDLFPRLAARVKGKVVTDMASTKAEVMGWAAAAGVDLIGGHPMAGREATGIDAADAGLFKDAPWILTADRPEVVTLVEAVGARPLVMNATDHDRLVAGVSHAAFMVSVAYVLSLSSRSDWPEASRVASSGFRDVSRLAAGDPQLYAAIASTNRVQLLEQLDQVSAALTRLRRHLDAGDPRLVELFEEARAVRERWAKGAK